MPLQICDKEPCVSLQEAMQKWITVPADSEYMQASVSPKVNPKQLIHIKLKYCPFCGTRIEEDWVDLFHQTVKKRMV